MRRLMVALAGGVVLLTAACANQPPGESLAPVPSPSATASQSASPSAGGALDVCWSAPAGGSGQLGFEDLTGRLGIEKALIGMRAHAVAVGDVNDDGWVDLFVGSFADRPVADYAVRGAEGPAPDRLLLGSATGFGIDQTFPGVQARTAGAAFADLDADGDLDLVLSRNPRDLDRGRAPSVVLRNDRGSFSEVAVLDAERGGRSVGILDLDADGLLDIVLLEDRWSGGSSVLYRNTGGLRFTDHTAAAGLPANLHGLGVSTTDLDGDRQPDLFVAGSNRLFLNHGGRFREEPGDVFAWQIFGDEDDVAGVAVGDLDRDGRPDLVLGQHFNSTLDFKRVVPVRVYRNLGPGEGRRVRF
ncbi:MAG: VCBS repeat-containing protein, partial [Micropruina sp.]